jgi:hypothetical protein
MLERRPELLSGLVEKAEASEATELLQIIFPVLLGVQIQADRHVLGYLGGIVGKVDSGSRHVETLRFT